jgi:hypothetical protein
MADVSRNMNVENYAKRYLEVIWQQGKPFIDADINEAGYLIRKWLQNLTSDLLGEGAVSTGFLITPAAADDNALNVNDFSITGGTFYINGYRLNIPDNVKYSTQPNYVVAGISALTTSTAVSPDPRVDEVYLDVWEDEIDATEDADLIEPSIGLECTRRTILQWAVRVHEDGTTPVNVGIHSYYHLATISRDKDETHINAADITDIRAVFTKLIDLASDTAVYSD